jgi:hypothetical protein
MTIRMGWLALGLAACALPGGGCATALLSGKNQKIEVLTEPPGATVTAGRQQILSPGVLKLPRREATMVTIEHAGFKTRTVVLTRKENHLVYLDLVGVAAGALAGAAAAMSVSGSSSGSVTIAPEAGAIVGGLVGGSGLLVDYLTGSAFRLDPARIVVTLLPEEAPRETGPAP